MLNEESIYDVKSEFPLCVDLDGTLIKTDSIIETILIALKYNPLLLVIIPFWFIKGRTYVKNKIIKYGIPNVSTLPYNTDVLNLISSARSNGRKIVLSTATKAEIALAVGEHLAIFDEIIFSTNNENNRSDLKAKTLADKFGEKKFDYIGNSYADLPVFEKANKSILVSSNKHLISKTKSINNNTNFIPIDKNKFKYLFKGMRIYQWAKNLLIFLPLLLAHEYSNSKFVVDTIIGFFCFSFTSSFIYLINDMMDLESDRRHSTKSKRPFAAGNLSPVYSLPIALILFVISLSVSLFYLPSNFGIILIAYLIITISYSFYLKKITIIDIVTLSILYSIRIIAGSEITSTPLSKWFLAFSLFLFFSLAIIKRYTELSNILKRNETKTFGRGYQTDDMSILLSMGTSSGYLSILIFLFYIFSPDIIKLYREPYFLMPVSVLLLIWISRMWFKARRGEMNEDPLVFTSRDKFSYIIIALSVIFIFLAI